MQQDFDDDVLFNKDEVESLDNPTVNYIEEYTVDDISHVLKQDNFSSWDDILDWVRNYGAHDNYLEPGRDRMILDDLMRIKNSGVEFTNDPQEIFNLAQQTRG